MHVPSFWCSLINSLQKIWQTCKLFTAILLKMSVPSTLGEGEVSQGLYCCLSNLLIWQDKHTLISIFFLIFSMLVQKQKHSPNYEFCINFFKMPFLGPPPSPIFAIDPIPKLGCMYMCFYLYDVCALPISCWWTFTFVF